MSRRAPRRRGPRPVALFAWTEGEEVVEDQAPDDRRNKCPVPGCRADPGQPCTSPSRRGRRNLRDVHPSRLEPQETQP